MALVLRSVLLGLAMCATAFPVRAASASMSVGATVVADCTVPAWKAWCPPTVRGGSRPVPLASPHEPEATAFGSPDASAQAGRARRVKGCRPGQWRRDPLSGEGEILPPLLPH